MDTELARTFLEVLDAGSFVAAAKRLNVTQSAVSLRVRTLEQHLGAAVFTRGKSGIALTPEGARFQRYAVGLVNFWEHALHEMTAAPDYTDSFTIGAEAGIWNRLLYRWLPWMRAHAPRVALRAEHGHPAHLFDHLVNGTHDIGVMYTPFGRPGLITEVLVEEDLILVSTRDTAGGTDEPDYVFVDWGERFRAEHRLAFPHFASSGLRVNLGTLALTHILNNGGLGYFPASLIRPHVDAQRLFPVSGAPTFQLPIYVSYFESGRETLIATALEGLRALVSEVIMLAPATKQ